jgi:hypothetical protein
MRHLSSPAALLAATAFVAACAFSARADAGGDLERALLNSLKQTSYHMTMNSPASGTIDGDIVNPGRMHMVMKNRNTEVIVVNQTMYMKQNGPWRKFPGVDIMEAQRNPLQSLAAAKGKFTVADLGPKVVDGTLLHAYRVTNIAKKNTDMVYVDGSDRVARIESGTTVVRLSNFGEAVTIVAPM